jgi:putative phosphoesterase
MKIIIVSDTHGNVKNFKKAVNFANKENIKLILHCGDIGSPESLAESLADFDGKFFGVLGNMDLVYKDRLEIYNSIENVKVEKSILELTNSRELVNGKNVAITHKPERARELAETGSYDLVFYGHTHKPWEEKIKTANNKICRLINPGELAGQIFKPCFAVYNAEKDFLELKILEKLR